MEHAAKLNWPRGVEGAMGPFDKNVGEGGCDAVRVGLLYLFAAVCNCALISPSTGGGLDEAFLP